MGFKKKQDSEEQTVAMDHLTKDEVCDLLSGNSATVVTEKKTNSKELWKYIGVTAIVLAVIAALIVGVGILFEKQHQREEAAAFAKEPKAGMTYFASDKEEAEKSKDEITWLVTNAYYTNDGSLAVVFSFANGMEKGRRIDAVGIKMQNEAKELIAEGASNITEKNLIVPADGTNTLIVYISPEHVKIPDDSLAVITWDVTVTSSTVE